MLYGCGVMWNNTRQAHQIKTRALHMLNINSKLSKKNHVSTVKVLLGYIPN